MTRKFVTCLKCGWVHMAVSRDYALQQIHAFNEYFKDLTPEQQQDFYGGRKSSMRDYSNCNLCGEAYTEMRPFKEGDCPDGVTIGPIIDKDNDGTA